MIDDFYTVTTPPAEEPITLTEAKEHLRVNNSADDTLITALIETARQFGEKFCNRIFITTAFDCYFSGLDASSCEEYPWVQLRRAPLISLTAVEVFTGGAYAATTDYSLKDGNGFARLIFADGIEADVGQVYPLKASITAGYGAAADVPEDIKTALKSHIAFLYENRGDAVAQGKLSMPLETRAIYSGKYRILNTY